MNGKKKEIRYFSMFTGVGGFELGLGASNSQPPSKIEQDRKGRNRASNEQGTRLRSGSIPTLFTSVGCSEIDKYASQLLKQKFPSVKNWGDATKINPSKLPDFELLVGGYPCQSFSIAGKRKGFDDTRGTLFFQIERIAKEKQPRIILLENVKGLLSHDKGNTFKTITQHLNKMGYLVDYRILNSKYFGVPQNRERIFHIGYNIKWMIKEDLEDGQIKRNTQLDKMLKGWMLENLLKDLEELKKLPEIKLKEWVLNYLRYICGNQTRLEYSKTINNLQTNNFQKSLKEPPSQSQIKEENWDLISKEKKNSLKMVQDIYESMMEKETDFGFIELWQKSILEILGKNSQFTTLTLIKKIIEKKTFSCAEINLIIGLFILQQKDYWEKWLNQEISDLIKLKEFIQHEGRRNKTKLRERYLLRNIRTSMGFTESFDESRNFIIGNLREESRPEILPLRETSKEFNKRNTKKQIASSLQHPGHSGGNYKGMNMLQVLKNSEYDTDRLYGTDGIARTMRANAGGKGAKTGLYAISRGRSDDPWKESDIAPSLRQRDKDNVHAVLTPNRENKRQNGRRFKNEGEPSFTLTGQDIHGVLQINSSKESGGKQPYQQNRIYDRKGIVPALPAQLGGDRNHLINTMKIRRLTPTECERLQGFPDNFTKIKLSNGKWMSDTQRYKQMGNAITTNVVFAIAQKLIKSDCFN